MPKFLLHVPKHAIAHAPTPQRVVNRIYVIDRVQWVEFDPSVNVMRIKYEHEAPEEIYGKGLEDPTVFATYTDIMRMLKTNADETRVMF